MGKRPRISQIPDVQIVDRGGKTRKIFEAERYPRRQRNRLREDEYNRLGIENETYNLNLELQNQ